MKRFGKSALAILLAVMCVVGMGALRVPALAATAIPYTVGTTASGSKDGADDVWYSVKIDSDGLYEISQSSTTTSNYVAGGSTIEIYDKLGSSRIGIGAGYRIADYHFNNFRQEFVTEFAVYLHKGEYLCRITRGTELITYSFNITKITPTYGQDREFNDDYANALTLAFNGKAGGTVGGIREDFTKDKHDYYVVNVPSPATIKMYVESEIAPVAFEVFDSSGNVVGNPFQIETKYSELTKKYTLEKEFSFEDAGVYAIRITVRSEGGHPDKYTPYTFTMGDGTGRLDGGAPASATPIQSGSRINLPTLTSGRGFRIFRSETSGMLGIVIADLVTGKSFVDVNALPNKTYYYTIREVMNDGSLGEISEELTVKTENELIGDDITGKKGFIMMKIGSPTMIVNGATAEIDPGNGTAPLIKDGRTLVPIRAIIEAIGGTAAWNEAARKVTLTTAEHSVEMWIGQKGIVVDGAQREMDVAPEIIGGRTMLPIRFVAENMGCAIEWIGSTQEIVIVFSAS